MQRWIWTLACAFGCVLAAHAEVPVTGGGADSLEALAGGSTLVTVILKTSLARDMNLTVARVEGPLIVFNDENGQFVVYQAADIREVRTQRGRVDNPGGIVFASPIVRADVAGAISKVGGRAAKIFERSGGNPTLRDLAAEVAGATGNTDAIAYLEREALSDEPGAALSATRALYALGQTPRPETLKNALRSGDRNLIRSAAVLAGIGGVESLREQSVVLVKDTAPEIYIGGAYAAGYFREATAIPYLLRGFVTSHEKKAQAAIFGLASIGDQEVRREMRTRLQTSGGNEWFYAALVLYRLGDREGVDIMRRQVAENGPHAFKAALILVQEDYWDANVFLRRYLDDYSDTSPEAFGARVTAAATLLGKGYVQAKVHLRDIFTMDSSDIYIRGQLNNKGALNRALVTLKIEACLELGRNGDVSVLPLLDAVLDDSNPIVVLMAGRAIVAITNPAYRERIFAPGF